MFRWRFSDFPFIRTLTSEWVPRLDFLAYSSPPLYLVISIPLTAEPAPRFDMTLPHVHILLALFLALLAAPLFGQSPDPATLSGTVVGQDGAPVTAAAVELVDPVTEITRSTVTDGEGHFRFDDLDPGIPFTFVVRATGFRTHEVEDFELEPGENRTEAVTLVPPDFALEGIDVTVDRRFDPSLSGPIIQITREEVTAHPSTERNFMELAALSPVAVSTSDGGEVSISGQNERHNTILVDGALNQDVFGASSTGIPGAAARAKPIPLDAIERFRIEAAPFDVGVSGFTGGVMEASTRSGTNTWEGSVFSEFRNESFFGSLELDGVDLAPETFSKHVWGFNVGGPIRPDEIHLFVAAEFEDRTEPTLGFVDGIHGPESTEILPDSLDRMAHLLADRYGIDAGTPGQLSLENPLSNLFARLDWQLSQAHRLSIRHNYSGAARDSMPNRSPVGPYELSSAGFRAESSSHALSARLVSRFGDGHANLLTANVQRIADDALPVSEAPLIDVTLEGVLDNNVLRRDARAGSRYFSQVNHLDQRILQLTNRTAFDRGELETTLGVGLDHFSFDHDFRPGARGYYRFDSLEELEMNRPSYYEVNHPNPDFTGPDVNFSVVQPHLYFQNEHTLPDGFVMTYGVRLDIPIFRGDLQYNEEIHDDFGLRTDALPSGRLTFTPRLGFNWQPDTTRRTQFRGTIGVFTAHLPYIWMSEAVRYNGMRASILACTGDEAPGLDPGAPLPTVCAEGAPGDAPPNGRVVAFKDNFAPPRELKITMALDQELPGGFLLTGEALFIPTFSRTAIRDVNLPGMGDPEDDEYHAAFGDRIHYGEATSTGYRAFRENPNYSQVIQIENEKRAALAWATTLQLERDFSTWLSLTGSVSFSATKDEQSLGFGDMATNLAATPVGRLADQYTARPANFDRPRKYLLSARMRTPDRLGGSRISILYVGQSGQPYSYVYNSDINGDGFPGPGIRLDAGNDLLYVPENPTDIPGSLQTRSLFAQFVNDVEECLSDVRGEIMLRNSCRTPKTHMVDLSISQPVTLGGLRIEVSGDLLNVLNLVNDEWGQVWEVDSAVPILDIVARSRTDMDGNYVPESEPIVGYTGARVRDPETGGLRPVLPHNLVVPASQWQAQVSLRIHF